MHKCNFDYIADTQVGSKLRCEEGKEHYLQVQLRAYSYPDAIVMPCGGYDDNGILDGGVMTSDLCYIQQSAYAEGRCKSLPMEGQTAKREPQRVIYAGFILGCYGHGITDNIKKLWWFFSDEYKTCYSDCSVVYITEYNKPLPRWQKEIYRLVGIDCETWIHVTETTQFDEIVIPDNSIVNSNEFRSYTKEYLDLIARIKQNVTENVNLGNKLYFTRTGIRNEWREYGEHYVEAMFRKNGYTIVSPEKYSVEQQVAMLTNCDAFVSTEGSCAHNSVFCKADTKVCILRKADYANSYQIMINHAADLDVTYIDVHHSSHADALQPWLGPFFIYVTPALASFFGKRPCRPWYMYLSYWVYKYRKWPTYFLIRKALNI